MIIPLDDVGPLSARSHGRENRFVIVRTVAWPGPMVACSGARPFLSAWRAFLPSFGELRSSNRNQSSAWEFRENPPLVPAASAMAAELPGLVNNVEAPALRRLTSRRAERSLLLQLATAADPMHRRAVAPSLARTSRRYSTGAARCLGHCPLPSSVAI